jgi:hypothetical protein
MMVSARGLPEPFFPVPLELRGRNRSSALLRSTAGDGRQEFRDMGRAGARGNSGQCAWRLHHLLARPRRDHRGVPRFTQGTACVGPPQPIWPSGDALVMGSPDRRRARRPRGCCQDAVLDVCGLDDCRQVRALRGRRGRDSTGLEDGDRGNAPRHPEEFLKSSSVSRRGRHRRCRLEDVLTEFAGHFNRCHLQRSALRLVGEDGRALHGHLRR